MKNYTVLAFLRNEPIRVKSIIENFKGRANIIALLDSEDIETESVLQKYNIKYIKRPDGFMSLSEDRKTKWILEQSPTEYVFICYASFFVSKKLLNVFDEVSESSNYGAIKHPNIYWSYGEIVQEPTLIAKSDSCHFFDRRCVNIKEAIIHDEFILKKETKILRLPSNKNHALHVMRDDDMPVVMQKHILYAQKEAKELLNRGHKKITYLYLSLKITKVFLNNYIRLGGYKGGIAALIYHMHYTFYQFLVYSNLWEMQTKKDFSSNRENHLNLRLEMIEKDKK